jgi:hypothetical protein
MASCCSQRADGEGLAPIIVPDRDLMKVIRNPEVRRGAWQVVAVETAHAKRGSH